MLFAPVIVTTLFGPAFVPAALPFQIVIWMIPVAWLSGHFRFSLIAGGHQRLEFMASAIAGLVTMLVALGAARSYGASGAAAALVAGGVVNAIAAAGIVFRMVGGVRLGSAAPAVLACAAFLFGGLAASAIVGRPVAAILACLAYALLAFRRWGAHLHPGAWEGGVR
jgi:O-antigen/teichoic acid export membrane protein